jgi:hypothetical protein
MVRKLIRVFQRARDMPSRTFVNVKEDAAYHKQSDKGIRQRRTTGSTDQCSALLYRISVAAGHSCVRPVKT